MALSQSVLNTSFLDDCISKKRTFQDIYEALGLFSESASAHKEPKFFKEGANDLHERIMTIARSFRASYRNDRDGLERALLETDALSDHVGQLAHQYGQSIWGRTVNLRSNGGGQSGNFLDQLHWDNPNHREEIRFYIRCWITRHAVQEPLTPRKGKSRASTREKTHVLSEGDLSDVETPQSPSRPTNTNEEQSQGFRAPTVPCMVPVDVSVSAVSTGVANADIESADQPTPHSPSTCGKRKANSSEIGPLLGKLQKVHKGARKTAAASSERRQAPYSLPDTPASYALRPAVGDHGIREDTCETDRSYVPQRAATVESETVIDEDEVLAEIIDLCNDVVPMTDLDGDDICSVTAGPSGTYVNPHRQNSVIPEASGPALEHEEQGTRSDTPMMMPPPLPPPQGSPDHCIPTPQTTTDISKPNTWQCNYLRLELFKLLLAYLNGINDFQPDTFSHDAEERMNNLLYQFWTNDAEVLRTRPGQDLARLETALETWMKMRYELTEFRLITGYQGQPGQAWKTYLRRINDTVARARAGIAFATLKSSQGTVGMLGPSFDDDLATVFDLLTQVEGCNGVEEFGGVRLYNEALLEWYL